MSKFFVRLVVAAVCDWFTWQISSPEMRFWRITRKRRMAIREIFVAIEPAAVDLAGWCQNIAREVRSIEIEVE